VTSPESPRILVIRRRYLGDIVLLGSVFLNLRRRWPSARIGALVERPYAGILPLNPDVDDVHTFPTRWSEWWGFLRQLRRHRYTHVLDFDNTERTAFVTRMSGASVRVAFDRELIPFRQSWVYTHSARVRNADYDRQPITTTYLALLQVIDVPVTHLTPRLVPRATDVETVRRLVAGAGRKVLVHPGTRSAYRRWPAERFATLCDRIQDELGCAGLRRGWPW
jgi:ADP-heptose:LPS heptosyltransferase